MSLVILWINNNNVYCALQQYNSVGICLQEVQYKWLVLCNAAFIIHNAGSGPPEQRPELPDKYGQPPMTSASCSSPVLLRSSSLSFCTSRLRPKASRITPNMTTKPV